MYKALIKALLEVMKDYRFFMLPEEKRGKLNLLLQDTLKEAADILGHTYAECGVCTEPTDNKHLCDSCYDDFIIHSDV